MVSDQLKKDFKYCEKIMKKASKSFYYAFSQLPDEKAKRVFAIYAFCRIVDDSIDEEPDKDLQIAKLTDIKEKLEDLHQIDEPIYRALSAVFKKYDCSKEPYFDQLAGQESDINFKQPRDLTAFIQYSDLVAGSVGRMLLPVLASETVQTDALLHSATELGIAMQITNILRDIGEDYRDRQRIYLPKSYMEEYGYLEQDLANNIINDSFKKIWESLAEEAEKRYDNFFRYLDQYDASTQEHIRKSALVYKEILNIIRENNYDCLTKRQYVPMKRMKEITS